jgi:hypothetical protein
MSAGFHRFVALPDQSGCRVEQLDRVVQLALRCDECLTELLHNGVVGFHIVDDVRVMRPVPGRLHPDEIEPLIIARTVTVHGTVNQNRRQPFAMRLDDVLDKVLVLHVREALVVNDDVEAFRPVRIVVQRDRRVGRRAALMSNRPDDVGSRRNTSRKNQLLSSVVVAATARNQQRSKRLPVFASVGRCRRSRILRNQRKSQTGKDDE